MSNGGVSVEPKVLEPSDKWINEFLDEWAYNKKLVVFKDAQGNVITPSTTTTTTPKPKTTKAPVNTTYSKVVVITDAPATTPVPEPRTDSVTKADTEQLLKVVGITCGTLISLVILVVCVIYCCRRASAKKQRRISLRRPLNIDPDVDHIYAEIEPLQPPRADSIPGASGTSADVKLPKKKTRGRRPGVSSFRAISTRIYRFFNVETADDQQSVFYNRSGHQASIQGGQSGSQIPPEPPERDIANGRRTKGRQVRRGESTASNRPLLEDSTRSSGGAAEMRSNIYNPLIKEQGEERQSGPYDHLTLTKTNSGHLKDPEPDSPHDYFTLEKANRENHGGAEEDEDNTDHLVGAESNSDSFMMENEIDHMDTIDEDEEGMETPKVHDYFVLEPHEKAANHSDSGSPTKGSVKSNKSSVKSTGSYKPNITPRKTIKSRSESSSVKSDTNHTNASESDADSVSNKEKDKDEVYVLAKLGDAPVPPPETDEGSDDGDEYLTPKDVERKADYIDVLPNPPDRSTSLQHDTPPPRGSPVKKSSQRISPEKKTSRNGSQEKKGSRNSSPDKKTSQKGSRNSSPEKKTSQNTSPERSVSPHYSPVKKVSHNNSPTASPRSSPEKKSSQRSSPEKTVSPRNSPEKKSSQKDSPTAVKHTTLVQTNSSTTTDV